MREVVTVQLGGYANFAGAHFWNLQDESLAQAPPPPAEPELRPDVFFRESPLRTARVPYAPRLQIVDAAGAFGNVSVHTGTVRRSRPTSKPPAAEQPLWQGGVQRYDRQPPPLSMYLKSLEEEEEGAVDAEGESDPAAGESTLEDGMGSEEAGNGETRDFGLDAGVTFWSDYLKSPLHHKSCYQIAGLHGGVTPFESYDAGGGVASSSVLDDAFDELRFFVEECEQLSGLSVVCDTYSGFSGFAERYLECIRDELGSSVPLCVFGTTMYPEMDDAASGEAYLSRIIQCRLNEALLVSSLSSLSAQYVPLRAHDTERLPYVYPRLSNRFHTSAVLGCAIDIATTPMREARSRTSLGGMLSSLRPCPSAVLSGLGLSLPVVDPVYIQKSAICDVAGMFSLSTVDPASPRVFHRPLSPIGEFHARPTAELVIARGVRDSFDAFCRISTRVAVPVPFPRFFDHRLNIYGRLSKKAVANLPTSSSLREVGELSALASMYTDGPSGRQSFETFSLLLQRASHKPSGMFEPATLWEMSESMTCSSNDYAGLREHR